ncbi:hypothetical protein [Thiosocius teredinicola]|uniref:hypothetical protein n=1 Tax=Thiosocius teredinicola TaxID=1973002 RepID=UPI000F7B5002
MKDPLEINIAGRVMMLLTRLGMSNTRCLDVCTKAVSAVVHQRMRTDANVNFGNVGPLIAEQLGMLEAALKARSGTCGGASAAPAAAAAEQAGDAVTPAAQDAVQAEAEPVFYDDMTEQPAAEEKPAEAPAKKAKPPARHTPQPMSMEDKLKEEREPTQKLLAEDCVSAGLIDPDQAKKLILSMTGKTSQDAETDIVEHLRGVLQEQVKKLIRKAKNGGPWASPHSQEQLRKDIHSAKTVRSVLTMRRQVIKELQQWEKEHGRGGILGLFSGRRKTAGR